MNKTVEIAKPGALHAQGDIMQLRQSKLKKPQNRGEELTAEFLGTIDNFAGIKTIDNFVLISLKDRMHKFLPEQAVGVLQLHNKVDGTPISKEDVARVQCYSHFIGAMAMRAQIVTCAANQLIKVMEDVKSPISAETWKQYRFAEGQGPMGALLIDTEFLEKELNYLGG